MPSTRNSCVSVSFPYIFQKLTPWTQTSLPAAEQYKTPSLLRWFDHVQHLIPESPNAPLVQFDLENAPKIEHKTEPVVRKKKEVAAAETTEANASTSKVEEATPSTEPTAKKEKAGKKEKKEKEASASGGKKEKGAGGGGGKAAAPVEPENPAPWMIDLRIGKIVEGTLLLLF